MNITENSTRRLSGVFDPAIESAGSLTIDTPLGPVDLVAVDRARRGWPTPLTPADRDYLYQTTPLGSPVLHRIAEAMGISHNAADMARRRSIRRQHAETRTQVAA